MKENNMIEKINQNIRASLVEGAFLNGRKTSLSMVFVDEVMSNSGTKIKVATG